MILWLARAALRLAVHPTDRACVLDDLDGELRRRELDHGVGPARRWATIESLRAIAPSLRARWYRRAGSAKRLRPTAISGFAVHIPAHGGSDMFFTALLTDLRHAGRRLARVPAFSPPADERTIAGQAASGGSSPPAKMAGFAASPVANT